MRGRVLVVAGSDSGGGAGIQADIKAVMAMGGYAATAITSITAQNTLGVSGVWHVPAPMIAAQIRAVMDDIGADVIKTGMLATAEMIHALADVMEAYPAIAWVVDPVMIAKGGAALSDDAAQKALVQRLLPRASLVTPNLPEAAFLSGRSVERMEDVLPAAEAILALGCKAVLMKGGHMDGHQLTDTLLMQDGQRHSWSSERIQTLHTHGTGCSMASAIAAGLAQAMPLPEAVARAHHYVRGAITHAPGLGQGHGPLNHGWMMPHSL